MGDTLRWATEVHRTFDFNADSPGADRETEACLAFLAEFGWQQRQGHFVTLFPGNAAKEADGAAEEQGCAYFASAPQQMSGYRTETLTLGQDMPKTSAREPYAMAV